MYGVNKVILVGHLGQEPEFRYLSDNNAVLSFSLVTTETVIKDGVKVEKAEWHNIIMWRGLAEAAANVLKKGKLVYLEGKCHTRSFIDKNGSKKYTTEIVADYFTPLGRNSDFEDDKVNTDEENLRRKRL